MEWLYGLLIGSTFTAVLMHLAHRGHKEEREVVKADGTILEKGGFTYQAAIPEPKTCCEPGDTKLYQKLDDLPKDCTCDWQENKRLCEEEGDWYRTMADPKCPLHGEPDEPIGDHKDWTHRTDL